MHSVTPHFLSWPSAQAAVFLAQLDAEVPICTAVFKGDVQWDGLRLCPPSHIINIPLYTNNNSKGTSPPFGRLSNVNNWLVRWIAIAGFFGALP